MKYSDREFYAAVRAEVLAYRPQLERVVREAVRLAQRNAAWRVHYAKQPFDESQHPRAPAGRPEGGEFVKAGSEVAPPSPARREFFVPKDMQPWAALHRADFDRLSSRTTAELQSALKTHTDRLLDRPSGEAGAYHRLWVDRIQKLLEERDHSDHNAPPAVKERIWAAQKEYTPLFVERVRLEKWLASSKRTIFKSRDQVRAVQEKLANIKVRMEELALITGATLPQHNPIRDWSFEQKFSRAAEIALRSGKLAPEIAEELRAAIEPANLARSAAMMAALAAAHAHPLAGFAADAILLAHVGVDGALTGHRIYLEISSIQSEADLNAAADVLRKELASQAAGKLTDLLTWGTGKGAAAFNKRYKITIDHDKVRRLSTGEMPLSPNPKNLIPLKVVKKTNSRPATSTKNRNPDRQRFLTDWLIKRFKDGQQFNLDNRHRYPHHEIEVSVGGRKYRVDSLDLVKKEIVSRRLTQLSRISQSTAIGYFNEFIRKYSPGSVITNSDFNPRKLHERRLKGKRIFEVPVQRKAIPKAIIDAATVRKIIIRDINGKVYNP